MNQNTENAPTIGEFESLNFIIDHPELDFVGYEFEGVEMFVYELGDTQSLFRIDIRKSDGCVSVHSAYSQDFDVMEEVTDQFDTDKLLADIKKHIEKHGVDNQGQAYLEYYQLIEDGYECDEAMSKLWEPGGAYNSDDAVVSK